MRLTHIYTTIVAIVLWAAFNALGTTPLHRLVNPLVGTDFMGNTYPGAQAPFGLVQLSPDGGLPGWDRIAGYFYPDSTIAGFSHTHLSGTGAGDLYDISFIPICGEAVVAPAPLGLHSTFSHDTERAHAGYYGVHLDSYDIDVELTATPHVGVQRYRFPNEAKDARVVLNLAKATNWDKTEDTAIQPIDSLNVTGHRFSSGWARDQRVWFATRFSRPYKKVEIADGVATFHFDLGDNPELLVITAISGTDAEGALTNLAAEAPHDDWASYLSEAEGRWDNALGAIEIEDATDERERVFYTALYHSMLAPVIYSDADGRYRGPDGKIHTTLPGHDHYSTFSLWDTYRAAHPLYTIICPGRAADMVESMISFGEQNGRLPVWNMWSGETDMMIGYHSALVIADALTKGIAYTDPKRALEISVKTATDSTYRQLGDYMRLGYIPAGTDEWTLSKTLEYAYDDAAISRMAHMAGDTATARQFDKRAANWRNLWNPQSGFLQPRNAGGSFIQPFDPEDYSKDICESNAWQYLWSVQHDPEGLAQAMGGIKAFERKLDQFFTLAPTDSTKLPIFSTGMIGQYAHGNEPGHHAAYLYNLTDHPEKGRKLLKRIMTELYKDTPDGLCGNEDCGQMSAWYVMSALGLYPVDPSDTNYWLGAPQFKSARIRMPQDGWFTIETADPQSEAYTPRLDGKRIGLTLPHSSLKAGSTLKFDAK